MSYYNPSSFTEWWKHHYGTDYDGTSDIVKLDGMTDTDIAIGNQLLKNYNQSNKLTENYNKDVENTKASYGELSTSLEKAYGTQIDALDRNRANAVANLGKSRSNALRTASVSRDRLEKYLPVMLKQQGLSGLGVSESATLGINSDYLKRVGSIEDSYQQNVSEVENNYADARAEADSGYNERMTELGIKEREAISAIERAYSDSMEGVGLDANGNSIVDGIVSGAQDDLTAYYEAIIKGSDLEDFTEILSAIAGKVSDSQYQYLAGIANNQAEANKAARESASAERFADLVNNNSTFESLDELTITDENGNEVKYFDYIKGKVGDEVYQTLREAAEEKAKANKAAREEKEKDKVDEKAEPYLLQLDTYLLNEDYEVGLKYLEKFKDRISEDSYEYYYGTFNVNAGKNPDGTSTSPSYITDTNNPNYNQQGGNYDGMTQEEKDERIISGKDLLASGGYDYKITGTIENNSGFLNDNADFIKQVTALGFKNGYDINLKNGTVIVCSAKEDGTLSADALSCIEKIESHSSIPSEAEISAVFGGKNMPTRYTLVYYNGQWYLAENKGATQKNAAVEALEAGKVDPSGTGYYGGNGGSGGGGGPLTPYVNVIRD